MTESDWATSANPDRMLAFAAWQGMANRQAGGAFLSPRKLRLYLVGCVRRRLTLVHNIPSCVEAVNRAEELADSVPTPEARLSLRSLVQRMGNLPRVANVPGREGTLVVNWDAMVGSAVAKVCEPIGLLTSPRARTLLRHVVADRQAPPGIVAAEVPADLSRSYAALVCHAPESTREDADAVYAAELSAYSELLRCIAGNPFRPAPFDPAWRTATATALAAGIYADRAFDRLPVLADALEDAGCDDAEALSHCRGRTQHARGCWVVDAVLGKQ